MPIDFKKINKELYQPQTVPSIINVPEMTFAAIDGKGDPNTSEEYASVIEALYSLSYAIKMGSKSILEYVVPPLEGFWSIDDNSFRGGGEVIADKSKFEWTMLIRQPDFVTRKVFESARTALAKKKPNLDTSKVRLEKFAEGLCVQVMHIGWIKMDRYAALNVYTIDINETRRHHEIYLSDPRKISSDKQKTVIRHPVKKVL